MMIPDLPRPDGDPPQSPLAAKIAAARAAEEARLTTCPTTGLVPIPVYPGRINFGRYKGRRIRYIPTDYLRWLLTISLPDSLRAAVSDELVCREFPPLPPDTRVVREGAADAR